MNNFIPSLPKAVLISFCISLTLLVGFLDYITGDYGITVVYILPVYLSAKLLGRRYSLSISSMCIVELIGFALLGRKYYESFYDAFFWNAVLQSLELGITGYLIAQFTAEIGASGKLRFK